MNDKVFLEAWAKALEEHGTNARINDVWEFNSRLEQALRESENND